jgi:hypothetical protein
VFPRRKSRPEATALDLQVEPGKVLASRWMRQFAHTWTHFAYWVPWVS